MNIEFDPVDTIGAGAFGQPGHRTFVIQARKGEARVSVLVEKEQVALLAAEAEQFLDRIDVEDPDELIRGASTAPVQEDEPLFRARLIGIGYDAERHLVLIELREDAMDDDEDDVPPPVEEAEGHVAKLYATRAQVRAMVAQGVEAVAAGRPKCELCDFPMDPDGHICPRWNQRLVAGIPDLPPVCEEVAKSLLRDGEIDVLGRMPWSSNATFLAHVSCGGEAMLAIYKPQRGERPLWDFPRGTLCHREVAAYEVSQALDWDIVPDTVLRDGPAGIGMLQRFVAHDPEEHYFTLLETHGDDFRRMAAFDVLINNTDRKGGHCLRAEDDGRVFGIDHGVAFHAQWKLRTVIWDFAGEELPEAVRVAVAMFGDRLGGDLGVELRELLDRFELDALRARAEHLLATNAFPVDDGDYHSYPWPLV